MTSVDKNILFYVARRLRWTTFFYIKLKEETHLNIKWMFL